MENLEDLAVKLYKDEYNYFNENVLEKLMEELYKTRDNYSEIERRRIWLNIVKRLQQLYA